MTNRYLDEGSLEKKIISLISKVLMVDNVEYYLLKNDNLRDLGLNSVKFILLIIEIEKELLIDFDDESLVFLNFYSYHTLKNYVINKVIERDKNGWKI